MDARELTLHLGARVRALRKARGLTQTQLAERAGVSKNHIHRIEVGSRRNVGPDVLTGLARGLGVPVEELTGYTPLQLPPDPWLVTLGERLDNLPEHLRAQMQRLIAEFVAVVEQPLVGYAQAMTNLLGETTELSEAELQAVAEYALRLVQEQATAEEGEADADTGAAASAG